VRASHVAGLASEHLLSLRNVIGAGRGEKVTAAGPTGELSLVVLVTRKLPADWLHPRDLIPKTIGGVPTDVVEVGEIEGFGDYYARNNRELQQRQRPLIAGCSLAHAEAAAGTLGCLVQSDGEFLMLTANHTAAMLNEATMGDPILQPSPLDGGTLPDRVGYLADYVPLEFERGGLVGLLDRIRGRVRMNQVDAALVRPVDPDLIDDVPFHFSGTLNAGDTAWKVGRSTGRTKGQVRLTGVTIRVNYGKRKRALFVEQLLATPMSKRGDSGAAVFNEAGRVAGMVIGGSERATIITPIQKIQEALGVHLAGQEVSR